MPISATLILGRPQVVGLKRLVKAQTVECEVTGDSLRVRIVLDVDGGNDCRISATELHVKWCKS